jgi:hypothetical protein
LICGIIRLAVLVQLGTKGRDITCTFALPTHSLSFPFTPSLPSRPHQTNSSPKSGNLIPPAIWTTIEPAVQITTACLPALRVLYRKYMENRRLKARSAAQQRLRSLELTSPRNGSGGAATTTHGLSTYGSDTFGSGTQGSWTTKDHSAREGIVERDVYV